MKLIFKQMLKVSAFYLEKQKSFINKKIFFSPQSISKQKKTLFTDPIYSEGFGKCHALFQISVAANIAQGI
jgi:hypothetical protein